MNTTVCASRAVGPMRSPKIHDCGELEEECLDKRLLIFSRYVTESASTVATDWLAEANFRRLAAWLSFES